MVDMAPRIEPEGQKKIQDFMNQKPEGFDSLEEVRKRYQIINHIESDLEN